MAAELAAAVAPRVRLLMPAVAANLVLYTAAASVAGLVKPKQSHAAMVDGAPLTVMVADTPAIDALHPVADVALVTE